MLASQVQTYKKFQDHSTDKQKGVGAMTESIIKTYELLLENVLMGSLIIVFNCLSIESLEHLWRDYLSGRLDEIAEQYLVTEEMKEKLNLEAISLQTTIKYENYLNCRKVLLEHSGEYRQKPFWANKKNNYLRNRKTFSMFLSSYRNTSGGLREREMVWKHEPQSIVSTAFSSALKLS